MAEVTRLTGDHARGLCRHLLTYHSHSRLGERRQIMSRLEFAIWLFLAVIFLMSWLGGKLNALEERLRDEMNRRQYPHLRNDSYDEWLKRNEDESERNSRELLAVERASQSKGPIKP